MSYVKRTIKKNLMQVYANANDGVTIIAYDANECQLSDHALSIAEAKNLYRALGRAIDRAAE